MTQKILIVQTAFIGDVILATGLIEKLGQYFQHAQIDFLVRKGNESLLKNNPHLNKVLIWNKKEGKYKSLLKIGQQIRKDKYDYIINLQRFGATGLLTGLSGAKHKLGFDKNPFSFLFSQKFPHEIGNGSHETERNHSLIQALTDPQAAKPKLYPSDQDFKKVSSYQDQPYICIAPTSVWFTKQFEEEQWIKLINEIGSKTKIFLLGGPPDEKACESIKARSYNKNTVNLAGKLSFLESAALMKGAQMNYVNDSAPMHIASSMNAPVTAIFCSTVPSFGFGPLSDRSFVVETSKQLDCRPCGLHGHKACPKGHFNCSKTIEINQLLNSI